MAVAAAVATVVAAGISIYGSIKQANAEKQAGEFNAEVAESNAERADRNARYVMDQTREQARRQTLADNKTLGSIRAAYGASGVTMDGTPEEYLTEQKALAQLNLFDINHAGSIEARGFGEQARNYRLQAGQYRKGGSAAEEAGYINAAGAGIGAAGKIASMNYSGRRSALLGDDSFGGTGMSVRRVK